MAKRIPVLLLERISGIGDAGEVVYVSEGYARNYLFPQGLAAAATEGRMNEAEKQKKNQERDAQHDLEEVEKQAQQIDGMAFPITLIVGPDGKAHGVITASDVAGEVEKTGGVAVPKSAIRLDEPIREAGEHKVAVEFPHGLEAEIILDVRAVESRRGTASEHSKTP